MAVPSLELSVEVYHGSLYAAAVSDLVIAHGAGPLGSERLSSNELSQQARLNIRAAVHQPRFYELLPYRHLFNSTARNFCPFNG